MALIDFTLSNARRFYSSMGNPLGVKGLTTLKAKNHVPINRPGVVWCFPDNIKPSESETRLTSITIRLVSSEKTL